jgi:hypothetical protein
MATLNEIRKFFKTSRIALKRKDQELKKRGEESRLVERFQTRIHSLTKRLQSDLGITESGMRPDKSKELEPETNALFKKIKGEVAKWLENGSTP